MMTKQEINQIFCKLENNFSRLTFSFNYSSDFIITFKNYVENVVCKEENKAHQTSELIKDNDINERVNHKCNLFYSKCERKIKSYLRLCVR